MFFDSRTRKLVEWFDIWLGLKFKTQGTTDFSLVLDSFSINHPMVGVVLTHPGSVPRQLFHEAAEREISPGTIWSYPEGCRHIATPMNNNQTAKQQILGEISPSKKCC